MFQLYFFFITVLLLYIPAKTGKILNQETRCKRAHLQLILIQQNTRQMDRFIQAGEWTPVQSKAGISMACSHPIQTANEVNQQHMTTVSDISIIWNLSHARALMGWKPKSPGILEHRQLENSFKIIILWVFIIIIICPPVWFVFICKFSILRLQKFFLCSLIFTWCILLN